MRGHATNGRGNFMLAVMCWRWRDAGAMQQLWTSGPRPDWIATVPAPLEKPHWIAPWARSCIMQGEDVCYWWTNEPP